ncbi:MAG TPA: hypothetical protein VGD50_08505 [Candidatus Baltobacteraceae bacterium]
MSLARTTQDPARLLWLLAVLVLAGGGYFIIKPAEQMLSATDAQTQSLTQQALTDEQALQNRARFEIQARQIRAELASITVRGNVSESTEALLNDVSTVAGRDAVEVTSLKPSAAFQTIPTPSTSSAPSTNPFDAAQVDDFDVVVRGSYRNIVAFLRDLSHMPTLTRVVDAQLDRSNAAEAADGTPSLDATVHIQTIRLDPKTLP